MNAPTQSTQEVHRDTTAKKNIEEAKKGKCVAVRNIAIAKPTTPMIDLDVAVKNVVLPIAVLVVVGVVVWAVFGIRAEVDGDRALARAKANFQRIADRIDSQTYSTASSSAATPTKLTLANFDRIRTGMSRYDVGDILGFGWKTVAENEIGQGTDFHVTTEALDWQDGLRIVTCMFQNGKLVQKAQAGLE